MAELAAPSIETRWPASGETTKPPRAAESIRPATMRECVELERAELARMLHLLADIPEEDWEARAGPGGATIRHLVAALAGGYAAQASVMHGLRQIDPRFVRLMRFPGEPVGSTIARIRTSQRGGQTPAALLAELRVAGEAAIARRQLVARAVSAVLPAVPAEVGPRRGQLLPLGAVRELWFRRVDIACAAGLGLTVSPDHDGRVLDLLMRPRVEVATRSAGATVDLQMEPDGPAWRFGTGDVKGGVALSTATLAELLAGRRSAEAIRERGHAWGDIRAVTRLLRALHGCARS